jgi:predicted transcriptional regulator
VREYVEREYAHLMHVREGEADIDAGRALTGKAMRAWMDDLKTRAAVQRGARTDGSLDR